MTLGLSMIVKNESSVLARALDSIVGAVDEIVIVDTGSTDNTADIAKRYTDKVFSFVWIDDFSAARNFALSKITADYFLWLDADDVVPESTAAAIKRLMHGGKPLADVIMLPYVVAADEYGKPTFSYYRERIIKNRAGYFWQGAVHEAVPLGGSIAKLDKPIIHAKPNDRQTGTRNLDIYTKLISNGRTLDPRERYYYARELFYNGRYNAAAEAFAEFLRVPDGLAANKADACLMLSQCFGLLGDDDSAMQAALYRFCFSTPDGEGCCRLGELFLNKNDYKNAAYWYERALRAKPDLGSCAFVQHEYYGFIPLMWLTVCYDRLGKYKKAFAYHLRAKRLRPNDKNVLINDLYFTGLGLTDALSETNDTRPKT